MDSKPKTSVQGGERLTLSETAHELRCSVDFVRDEISRRKLAVYRLGWRLYVSRDDLSDYLKRSRISAFGEQATPGASK